MGKLKTHVEIPVTVTYDAYPAEGDNWNSPKIPAGLDVECVEVPKDIEDYILKKFADQLHQECLDDAEVGPDEPDPDRYRNELHPTFGRILNDHLGEADRLYEREDI